jgi:4-amino-4-deoxy-L-arabinose transferase-like glycosyltransferase
MAIESIGSEKNKFLIPFLLVIAGALMFLPFLGKTHLFDWDEINFAECAREMIMAKNYFLVTIDYKPFWEKPPLFIWMQALSMKALGIGEYAARLPNALCGIALLLILFRIGTILKDKLFGLLWVLAYAGSLLPHLYFKSGIIDPWFNLFIFLGFYFFIRYQMLNKGLLPGKSNNLIILSALFIALALMTKGPVAFLVFLLCAFIYWLIEKRRAIISLPKALLYLLVLAIIGGTWFGIEILTGHWDTVKEFVIYQVRLFKTEDSGQGGPFYYHFVVLLIGCFPASIFAIRGMMTKTIGDAKLTETSRWMSILFWVVLILFSIVKTKIIHYSSLCYYPLTYFAAVAIYQLLTGAITWKKWMGWSLGIIGGALGFALAVFPIAGMHIQSISALVKDPFAVANMQAIVNWSYFDSIAGMCLLIGLISALVFIRRKNMRMGIVFLFMSALISTNIAIATLAPKIELYSQNSALEFFESLKGKDVYVSTLGYKSYAQYFYSGMQPWKDIRCTDNNWLLTGDIDKPAYFSAKITSAEDQKKGVPDLKELYRKNGFVFFERLPKPH